jgi:acetolactate synthase-1/2/3 large subunit
MLDIGHPEMDWTALARGFGIEASRAEDIESFDRQFAEAMRSRGPRLIEAVVP